MSDTTADRAALPAGRSAARRPSSKGSAARLIMILVAVLAIAAVGYVAIGWWSHGRFVQSTNDAYLRADQTTVAPKVSGYVDEVFVTDNQAVVAGQPLVRIDTRNYQASVEQQVANIETRRAELATAEKQVAQQQAAVDQRRSQLAGAQTDAAFAAGQVERYRVLSGQGVETREKYDQTRYQLAQATSAVRADADAVRIAEGQAATTKSQIAGARAQLAAAEASARSARLNLGDTLIKASTAGRIGDKTVRAGQFVQPGTRMMSIVPVDDIYLVANFKETQIGRMRVGQHAQVHVDALGDREIDAVIDSFAPGTGAQFSLLPPENATGNFTKIVQRVPVRLRLRPPAELRDRLLPGLSAAVKVDTTQSAGPRR